MCKKWAMQKNKVSFTFFESKHVISCRSLNGIRCAAVVSMMFANTFVVLEVLAGAGSAMRECCMLLDHNNWLVRQFALKVPWLPNGQTLYIVDSNGLQ